VPYPPDFLRIQVMFARKLSDLSRQPLAESLLRNTALYRIMGLDWSLDPRDVVWQRFIAELESSFDSAYRFYAKRYAQGFIPDYDTSRPHWGCFSYEYLTETRAVRLHFTDLDRTGYGPLSSQRMPARLVEVRAMFLHIRDAHPDAEQVKGGSWLYNRVEYRRLFPPEFGQSARPDRPHLIARGLWGQFLRHGNRMNEELATQFLGTLAILRDDAEYATCFPYQNLLTAAPVGAFYAFYSRNP
jgi:hypothetical protein